jgi:hypothetical protein
MNTVSTPVPPPSRTYRLQIDHLLVLVQSRSIMASRCISKLARSRPPSASPHSLNRGLQLHLQSRSTTASKLAGSWPPSASPNSLDQGLQLNLLTRSITASKCISKRALLRPASSHDHGLQAHLPPRSMTASECISEFIRLSFSSAPRSWARWSVYLV